MATSGHTLWETIRTDATVQSVREPVLDGYLKDAVLNQPSIGAALAFHLAGKLASHAIDASSLQEIFNHYLTQQPAISQAMQLDLQAIIDRDSACHRCYLTAFLFYKGFHALQAYRIAHALWNDQRQELAIFLQSRISAVFAVDIHPAASIGSGVLLDHATGIVIGETAVVANNVSIMQSVTLGGTGKESGDRHPKIMEGVLIGAGAKVLGNIIIGEGAKIAACSVILKPVGPHEIVAGVPATVIGTSRDANPALAMDHSLR